jgi:hypothetical protein
MGRIEVSEIRRVINHIMSYSDSEMRRLHDRIEAEKDEDPAHIAQLHIKLVEHSAEWNTAFLIANELSIKLDGDEQNKNSLYKRIELALEEHQSAMEKISIALSKSDWQNDPSLSEICMHLADTQSYLKNVLRRWPAKSQEEETANG